MKAHFSGKVSGLVGQDEETEDVRVGEDMRMQQRPGPPARETEDSLCSAPRPVPRFTSAHLPEGGLCVCLPGSCVHL